MAKSERRRDLAGDLPGPHPRSDYFEERRREGWRLVAVEWRRGETRAEEGLRRQEVPYGFEVAEDCHYLVENPDEMGAMTLMLDQIVADRPLSEVAEEVNRRGFRRRDGNRWTQVAIFNLLPRLVEVAPDIYATDEWSKKSRHLHRLVS